MRNEEKTMIENTLVQTDKKLSQTLTQKSSILNVKVDSLRKRNQSLSDKLSMFRTQETMVMKDTVEKAE